MKIYDFNVHLPYDTAQNVEHISANETIMGNEALVEAFDHYLPEYAPLQGMNFMLFNQQLFDGQTAVTFPKKAKKTFPDAVCTAVVDFRKSNPFEYIDYAKSSGVSGIKFHPYIQKISDADFSDALKVAQYAAQKNMHICVDASYGTTRMYKYDNLKLICHLADFITNVPIIILHSGGARCLEAMLIAAEKQNVYIETSFTLPYYLGSSIEQDLAFVYRKVGTDRVLYASDAPYISIQESIDTALNFFRKHQFSEKEIEKIFYQNAVNMLFHE